MPQKRVRARHMDELSSEEDEQEIPQMHSRWQEGTSRLGGRSRSSSSHTGGASSDERSPQAQSTESRMSNSNMHLDLEVTSWRAHPKEVLDGIWEDIKENTNAPDEFQTICMNRLSETWRAWKRIVKAQYYEKYKTDEERRMNKLDELDPAHWETLIKYWGRKSTKMMEKKEPIDKASVWRKTRRKKDRTFDEKDGAKDYEEQLSHKKKKSQVEQDVFVDQRAQSTNPVLRS